MDGQILKYKNKWRLRDLCYIDHMLIFNFLFYLKENSVSVKLSKISVKAFQSTTVIHSLKSTIAQSGTNGVQE